MALAPAPRTALRTLVSAATLLALALSATSAGAALIVYDPFSHDGGPSDYLLGDESTGVNVIGGQNPTPQPTPFYAGGWIQSGGDAQAVAPGSLVYPLFPNAGGRVTDAVQFNCCSFGRSAREIAGGLGATREARTIYQSFLVDFGGQGTDDPSQFGKRAVEWYNGGIGDPALAVDLFVNHFSGVHDLTLEVTTPSGTTSALLGGGGLDLEALAGTHLVVMKFEFRPVNAANPFTPADDDVVTVYLDPTDSIEANWAPAASIAVELSDLQITHHSASTSFTFSGGGHLPASFDELRWGDTFADVTPFVPEPGTLTMIGIGVAGLAARRRGARSGDAR
ncbi:MAG: hypothetical protein DCC71_11910 [Proteobacteria bacterium]|nr:MAG: hypothetical protein DCC71_11910 [Pseudomonadota bacterium]